MAALDNAAAENAQNLLNGIDYGALIGGPLQAAITAQATAARSTWEFIQQVGLNTDDDGNKTAVNVTFMYQKEGEMVRLIVPILTIVPIPMIVIDEVDIQFKANINASASSSSEESESQNINASMSGHAKVGWGPFSLSVNAKAGYSSKKDSKATQDSRYSVEYTQDVHVHASQADMPAGLSTVLNILSNSATGGSRDGELIVSPTMGAVDISDPDHRQHILITVKDPNGLVVPQATVTVDIPNSYVTLGKGPLGVEVKDPSSLQTDEKGKLSLVLWVKEEDAKKAQGESPFEVAISAKAGSGKDAKEKKMSFPVKISGSLPSPEPSGSAKFDGKKNLEVPDGSTQPYSVELKGSDGKGINGKDVTVKWSDPNTLKVSDKNSGKAINQGDTVPTGNDGKISLTVSGEKKGSDTIKLSAQVDGEDVEHEVSVTVK